MGEQLIKAAKQGHRHIVSKLIGLGTSVNYKNEHGDTPLTVAVCAKKIKVVEILLTHGAGSKGTALLWAAHQNNYNMIKLLLQHDAKSDTKGKNGYTALHYAIDKKTDLLTISTLVAYGADIHARTNQGNSALDLAKIHKAPQAIQDLLGRYSALEKIDLDFKDTTCSICKEVMTGGTKLQCGHYFHHACIHQWTTENLHVQYVVETSSAKR